jgi:pimeloyl-ACP methyl ester carboxylesterase
MRWQELRAPEQGVRLHVRRVVDPTAPPVLLLHGLGAGGIVWQNFARRLLPHLAAVAPDLRGHGQSDAPPDGYQPADYASDLAALIAALQLETPVGLVGHSLGALVGLALAEQAPEVLKWLALLDPPLDAELRNSEVPDVYQLRHAGPGELEAYLLARNPGGGELLAKVLANLFRRASDAAFEAMLDSRPVFEPARIGVDCLVVQADPRHGGVLGDAAAGRFVEQLPRGSLQKIDGASHALHASHPGQVAEAILAFGGYVSSVSSASR